jgi:DNA polymerase I
MDNLLLWKRYHDSPKKYTQMKYLAKEMKNYINNSRNFQIQSLSASITNRACIAINRELKRKGINGSVIAQIHDQIIVEVPKKDAEECRKMVQFLMENVYKLSLKLKAPAEIGLDFSDAH